MKIAEEPKAQSVEFFSEEAFLFHATSIPREIYKAAWGSTKS